MRPGGMRSPCPGGEASSEQLRKVNAGSSRLDDSIPTLIAPPKAALLPRPVMKEKTHSRTTLIDPAPS
jgi:hypothetical protein